MDKGLDIKKAAALSVVFHLLLAGVMLKISVELGVEAPAFAELSLGAISGPSLSRIIGDQVSEPGGSPGERVMVPERRMIEIEEPTIHVSKEEKVSSQESVKGEKHFFVPERATGYGQKGTSVLPRERKETFAGRKIDMGVGPGRGLEAEGVGAEVQAAFRIEGDIKGREILENPLPRYPPDLQKEVDIKINISVLPDGKVSSMRIVQKGDARLENLSMVALKQWKFSRLGEEQEQVVQTGTITLIYRLK